VKLRGLALFLMLGPVLVAFAAESPETLLAEGKSDAAIAALKDRVASSPSDAEAYHLLCRAYYSIQDWDHAMANGEKAVRLSPE